MNPFQAINTIFPLAFTSGINLYLTVLVVGLSIRFGWVPDAPASLHVLATLPVLLVAGIFYALEFCADKIPFIDTIWDLIHTFIRPVGAGALMVAGLTGTGLDVQTEVLLTLAAGAVALTSHSGKAGTRTVVNVASPVENLSNIVISLLEDLGVAILALLALRYPTAANIVTIGLLVLLAIFVPQLLGWAWFTLRAVVARLKAFVYQVRSSDQLPPAHAALPGHQTPLLCLRCRTQNIREAHGRYGYLSLSGEQLSFTYQRWFRLRLWRLDTRQIDALEVQQRVLVIVLAITYRDEKGKAQVARFVTTHDRRELMEQFGATLRTPHHPPAARQ